MTTADDALVRPSPRSARRARRRAVHTFRPRRSWPALIAGVLLLLAAALAAVGAISALVGSPSQILPFGTAAEYLGGLRWSDAWVRGASAVLAAIGLLLIVLALVPGRGRWRALRTGDPTLVVGLADSGLRRTLGAAAESVDGVRRAHVSVGRRKVRVRVSTELRDPKGMPEDVRSAVQQRLSELEPVRRLKVRTRVRQAKA